MIEKKFIRPFHIGVFSDFSWLVTFNSLFQNLYLHQDFHHATSILIYPLLQTISLELISAGNQLVFF